MKSLFKNIAKVSHTFDFLISFLRTRIPEKNTTGGVSGIRYPFEIFVRNISLFLKHSPHASLDNLNIAEFGPGDSLILGYLFTHFGANSWSGFDAFPYNKFDQADELIRLNNLLNLFDGINIDDFTFQTPGLSMFDANFPQFLVDYPKVQTNHQVIYKAPYSFHNINENFYDFIYSQACFEHISDPGLVYESVCKALKSNGLFINHIDFKSHGRSLLPTGHYRYSKKQMQLINSSHVFRWINGLRPSEHINIAQKAGLSLIARYDLNVPINLQYTSNSLINNEDRISSSILLFSN